LEYFHLVDVAVHEGYDSPGRSFDEFTESLIGYFLYEFPHGKLLSFGFQNCGEFSSHSFSLSGGGITKLRHLILSSCGHRECEKSNDVAVECLHSQMRLDYGMKFSQHSHFSVSGQNATIDISENCLAFDIVRFEMEVSVSVLFVLGEVTNINDVPSTFEPTLDLGLTDCLGGDGLSDRATAENGRGLYVKPFFPGELVNYFLDAFLALS